MFQFTIKEERNYYDIYLDSLKFYNLDTDENENRFYRSHKRYRADLYVSELMIIFEVQGDQHVSMVSWMKSTKENDLWKAMNFQKKRDEKKRNFCRSLNIGLIEITYKDINKHKKDLEEFLSDKIQEVLNERKEVN